MNIHQEENKLLTNNNLFICIENQLPQELTENQKDELEYIKQNFCGNFITFKDNNQFNNYKNIYYCGNTFSNYFNNLNNTYLNVYCIKEYCSDDKNMNNSYSIISSLKTYLTGSNIKPIKYISKDSIPLNIHGLGVLIRNYFDIDLDYFTEIEKAHKFQNLTESNKQGKAYRTGLYMTNVDNIHIGSDRLMIMNGHKYGDIKFNLLRCSSNLSGPTENFRDIDNTIINSVNNTAKLFFEKEVNLNHVLAQIYHNQIDDNNKSRKAKIKEHSDKTKDMRKDAIMAFCTFYKNYKNGVFGEEHMKCKKIYKCRDDLRYNNQSILTTLRFRLKKCVQNSYLPKTFDVLLTPNSLFMMSLYTNRLYTHEIIPAPANVGEIPTRMGYVIRCSDTQALFRDGKTYIVEDVIEGTNNGGNLPKMNFIELVPGTEEKIKEVKDKYYAENTTTKMVYYNNIDFSMNEGDYMKPNF
jgi:hypothetical protein